ncbi:NAD(P)H-dependent oxidoreductase [Roseibium salinum]|uniref:NAD(P)H-dependent oxidoreductase n=1 Tax=Roseibium salinum TaxID=1604349 RepID=A0ABT3QZ76_9HYPH|nr:NAD(P)H-dependent oxidoreductase [Roseibium sp. DSM 29163]MCX2722254.1 NAD(P)H-dependent oxidoreductase [Roseibium sp. DSM 29163]
MTRILILDGHPAKDTFCQALGDAYAHSAWNNGHEVRVRHLSGMAFNPDFGQSTFSGTRPWEPDLQALWDDIVWCEHFVVVHPLWWGGLPAKLKGVFDRILLPGMAFRYVSGKPLPEKLLAGRTAEVLVTSDTPGWYFRWIYGSGARKQTEKQILDFCGLKPRGYHMFAPVRGSSGSDREKMLSRAGQLGRRAA